MSALRHFQFIITCLEYWLSVTLNSPSVPDISTIYNNNNISDDDDNDENNNNNNNKRLWTTRWGIITGPPTFKRHNLVSRQFIYMNI